jgi:hypothetical protein
VQVAQAGAIVFIPSDTWISFGKHRQGPLNPDRCVVGTRV